MRLSFFGLFFLIAFSSCLSDLRPKVLDEELSSIEAAELLRKASYQHGYELWVQNPKYTCTIQDNFYGFVGKVANPLKGDVALFEGEFDKETRNGVLSFKDEKEGEKQWIFKDNKTFLNEETQIAKGGEAKLIRFWIPTYQYFIEFPFKITEATAIEYLGKESFLSLIHI